MFINLIRRLVVFVMVSLIGLSMMIGCAGRQQKLIAQKCGDRPFPGRPIKTVAPRFPAKAVESCLKGYVELELLIDSNGYVAHIQVVGSDPPGVFEQAAVNAAARWRYCPEVEGVREYHDPIELRLKFEHRGCLPGLVQQRRVI